MDNDKWEQLEFDFDEAERVHNYRVAFAELRGLDEELDENSYSLRNGQRSFGTVLGGL